MSASPCVVLVVDDEEPIRDVLQETLEQLGYKVICAESGDKAAITVKSKAVIDAVLTDIIMPGSMNGFDLIESVRTLRPNVPTIAMSGYVSKHGEKIAMADRFLHKPFTIAALEQALQTLLPATCSQSGGLT